MNDTPMMKCGHAANATDNFGKPVCVICYGIREGADEVDKNYRVPIDRRARCSYYGKRIGSGRAYDCCECSKCQKQENKICYCEINSSTDLPFFCQHSDKDFDEYYCGCHGWD